MRKPSVFLQKNIFCGRIKEIIRNRGEAYGFTKISSILLFLQDGKAHSTKEIKQYTQKYFSLKEEDIIEKLASGGQTVFTNRNAWALLYLKNAILIENTSRGIYQITQRGLDVLKDAPDVLNNQYLKRFPEFQ